MATVKYECSVCKKTAEQPIETGAQTKAPDGWCFVYMRASGGPSANREGKTVESTEVCSLECARSLVPKAVAEGFDQLATRGSGSAGDEHISLNLQVSFTSKKIELPKDAP